MLERFDLPSLSCLREAVWEGRMLGALDAWLR